MNKRQKTIAVVCIVSMLLLNGCEKNIPMYDKLSVAPVIQVADPPEDEKSGGTQSTPDDNTTSQTPSLPSTYSRPSSTYRRTYTTPSRYYRPSSRTSSGSSGTKPTPKPVDAKPVSISVVAKAELLYAVGESFDPEAIEVTVNMSDKTAKALSSKEYTTDFSSETPGKYTLTVTYEGLSGTVEYTVAGHIVTYTYVDPEESHVVTVDGDTLTVHYGGAGQLWYTDQELTNEAALPFALTQPRITLYGRLAESADFEYTVNPDGATVELTKYTGSDATVNIPDTVTVDGKSLTVTSLSNGLFDDNAGVVEAVILPDGVSSVTAELFMGCTKLEAILVNSTNTHFASVDGVLYSADLKRAVAYPPNKSVLDENYSVEEGVETIGKYAFYGSHLVQINLPQSVRTIEDGALWSAQTEYLICDAKTPPALTAALEDPEHQKIAAIIVPSDAVESYKAAPYWSEYADMIQAD